MKQGEHEMNKKELTYVSFIETLRVMLAEGLPPSVRVLRARLGVGSNSTIVEYLRRWRSESALGETVEEGISESFKTALRAEFGRVAQVVRADDAVQLSQAHTQLQEVTDLLRELEARGNELEAQRQAEQAAARQMALALEKQLAARDERVSELERRLNQLSEQLTEVVAEKTAAQVAVAKAEGRVEQAEKTIQKSEQQLEATSRERDALKKSLHEAEIQAAVAESRREKPGK